MSEQEWSHNGLLADLAEYLKGDDQRMVFTDVPMGAYSAPRPDVWKIQKSFANKNPIAYEIKVSLSDFRSDVTSGKWMKYLDYSAGVIFCVPKGLITKNDLPDGCGLMVRSEKGWRTAKKPTLKKVSIADDIWMRLLLRVHQRMETECRIRDFNRYKANQKIRQELGNDVADWLKNRESAESDVRNLEIQIEALEKTLEAKRQEQRESLDRVSSEKKRMFSELCQALGIEPTSNQWQIERSIRELKTSYSERENVGKMIQGIQRLQDICSSEIQFFKQILDDAGGENG